MVKTSVSFLSFSILFGSVEVKNCFSPFLKNCAEAFLRGIVCVFFIFQIPLPLIHSVQLLLYTCMKKVCIFTFFYIFIDKTSFKNKKKQKKQKEQIKCSTVWLLSSCFMNLRKTYIMTEHIKDLYLLIRFIR